VNEAWTPLLVAAGVILGPLLLAYLNGRQRRAEKADDAKQRQAEKAEDYARQDLVAERLTSRQDEVAAQAAEAAALLVERQDAAATKAAEAARLLLAAQKASIERTDEVARLAAEAARMTSAKLDSIEVQGKAIHTLVNQKLTDVTEQALAATLALLPHLEETIARQRAGGGEPSEADLKRLEDTKRSVIDLEANLVQRAEQQAKVDADPEAPTEGKA
jgi:hypothetical protein